MTAPAPSHRPTAGGERPAPPAAYSHCTPQQGTAPSLVPRAIIGTSALATEVRRTTIIVHVLYSGTIQDGRARFARRFASSAARSAGLPCACRWPRRTFGRSLACGVRRGSVRRGSERPHRGRGRPPAPPRACAPAPPPPCTRPATATTRATLTRRSRTAWLSFPTPCAAPAPSAPAGSAGPVAASRPRPSTLTRDHSTWHQNAG